MALDPSIALGYRPPQINLDVPSPIQQMGQVLSLRGLMEQQQLRRMQIDQEQMQLDNLRQANAGEMEFRRRIGAGENLTEAQTQGLLGSQRAAALFKARAERTKEDALAQKASLENSLKQVEGMSQLAAGIRDLPTRNAQVAKGLQLGFVTPQQAQTIVNSPYNQAEIDDLVKQGMAAKDRIKAELEQKESTARIAADEALTKQRNIETIGKQLQQDAGALVPAFLRGPQAFADALAKLPPERQAVFADAKTDKELLTRALSPEQAIAAADRAATQTETARHNLESERLTRVGQLMTDSRARELAAEARQARLDAAANKPPTEAQYTVAGYASRMNQAEKTFDAIPTIGVWNTNAPNWAMTTEGQQFDQASRNFINATLRRESGAAISSSEFDNAYRQYLPRPNDSPEVLKQKAENRALIRESFKSAAGKAYESPEQLLEKAGKGRAAAPDAVKSLLGTSRPGTYTLSDGTRWTKSADGTISPVGK